MLVPMSASEYGEAGSAPPLNPPLAPPLTPPQKGGEVSTCSSIRDTAECCPKEHCTRNFPSLPGRGQGWCERRRNATCSYLEKNTARGTSPPYRGGARGGAEGGARGGEKGGTTDGLMNDGIVYQRQYMGFVLAVHGCCTRSTWALYSQYMGFVRRKSRLLSSRI